LKSSDLSPQKIKQTLISELSNYERDLIVWSVSLNQYFAIFPQNFRFSKVFDIFYKNFLREIWFITYIMIINKAQKGVN
jgi:hypothetical protein